MKQQIIEFKKKLLLIELPEGAKDIHINEFYFFNTRLSYQTETSLHFIETKERLLEDKIKLIGKLTDITESQCEQWVEAYTSLENRFRNYTTPAYIEFLMKTAKESFFSKLQADEIYFENPLGEKPVLDKGSLWGSPEQDTQAFAALNYQIDKWEEAESKVWDINRCWIFEIL